MHRDDPGVVGVGQSADAESAFGAARTTNSWLLNWLLTEDINFLVTNRIPRRLLTKLMGWYSRIQCEWLTRASIRIWKFFSPDLDLSEAKSTRFSSLRDCFVRELKPGSRPIDSDPTCIVSPCDAIVGAYGRVQGTQAIQAKGFPYPLIDLLGDERLVEKYRDGWFVTLRLRSSMYHRFHAPVACRVRRVRYIAGDTWNVNPIALRRVERLFCKNERAVIDLELGDEELSLALVPVAAILVASIRIHALRNSLDSNYQGRDLIECDATYGRGDEMGWFEHGSTIIVFASGSIALDPRIREEMSIRMGQSLFRVPAEVGQTISTMKNGATTK